MRASHRGQSLTEVAIVLALIAIASIAVVTFYGDEVRKTFGWSSGSLAGETNLKGSAFPDKVKEKHNMGDFASQTNEECSGGVCSYQ
jgi:Flp pilus assembly pilin Flp